MIGRVKGVNFAMKKYGFTIMEILLVVMMISAGILPIYSLIHSSNKRLANTDTKIIATIIGSSAIEMAKTIGFEKAKLRQGTIISQNNYDDIAKYYDEDFAILLQNAAKNGYNVNLQISPLTSIKQDESGSSIEDVIRLIVIVEPKEKNVNGKQQVLKFTTLLTDSRAVNY